MPTQSLELTFGLDFLQVGRDDDALDLLQLQVLGDLAKPQHHAPLALGLCVARDTSKLGVFWFVCCRTSNASLIHCGLLIETAFTHPCKRVLLPHSIA